MKEVPAKRHLSDEPRDIDEPIGGIQKAIRQLLVRANNKPRFDHCMRFETTREEVLTSGQRSLHSMSLLIIAATSAVPRSCRPAAAERAKSRRPVN